MLQIPDIKDAGAYDAKHLAYFIKMTRWQIKARSQRYRTPRVTTNPTETRAGSSDSSV